MARYLMRNTLRLLTRSLAFYLIIVNGSDITTYGVYSPHATTKKYDLTVYMDTPINLKAVKKTKFSNHTAICSAMIAESHALNKEKKAEERAVVKGTKKRRQTCFEG